MDWFYIVVGVVVLAVVGYLFRDKLQALLAKVWPSGAAAVANSSAVTADDPRMVVMAHIFATEDALESVMTTDIQSAINALKTKAATVSTPAVAPVAPASTPAS